MKKLMITFRLIKEKFQSFLIEKENETLFRQISRKLILRLFRFDFLFKKTGNISYRILKYLIIWLIILIIFAIFFWDKIILLLYEITWFNITFVPLILVLIFTFTYVVLFEYLKNRNLDPVRDENYSFKISFWLFFLLNIIAVIIFYSSWEFSPLLIQAVNLIIAILNFIGLGLLIYLFNMRWYKRKTDQLKIHLANVYSIRKTKSWDQVPKYIQKKLHKKGWKNVSSIYINSVYDEFLKEFDRAMYSILSQFLYYQFSQTKNIPKPGYYSIDTCLKFGNALANYCKIYQDANGNHYFLMQEIFWRITNLKINDILLKIKFLNSQFNFDKDLDDFSKLLQFYDDGNELTRENFVERNNHLSCFSTILKLRNQIMQNRIFHLFLTMRFYKIHENKDSNEKFDVKWMDIWKQMKYNEDDKINRLLLRLKEHEEKRTVFYNLDHMISQIFMELGLDPQVILFFKINKELIAFIKKQKEDIVKVSEIWKDFMKTKPSDYEIENNLKKLTFEYRYNFWYELQRINGFKSTNINKGLTRLLMTISVINEKNEQKVKFPFLWGIALLIWLFEDFINMERLVSSIHFVEFIESMYSTEFINEIIPDIERILSSINTNIRWQENRLKISEHKINEYFRFWIWQHSHRDESIGSNFIS